MKKIFFTVISLVFINISAQYDGISSTGMGLPGNNTILTKLRDSNASKNLTYDDVDGSPYYTKAFHQASMAENYEIVPTRYNSYDDQIEYEKNDKVYVMPKEEKFSRIVFKNINNDVFVLLDTNDDNKGYFLELVEGKTGLYKKIKTKFYNSAPAKNSYDQDKPAQFKTLDPVYYIKFEKDFIKQPKNIGDVKKFYKGDENKLSNFVKTNKIKFNKEEDLIKLTVFMNEN